MTARASTRRTHASRRARRRPPMQLERSIDVDGDRAERQLAAAAKRGDDRPLGGERPARRLVVNLREHRRVASSSAGSQWQQYPDRGPERTGRLESRAEMRSPKPEAAQAGAGEHERVEPRRRRACAAACRRCLESATKVAARERGLRAAPHGARCPCRSRAPVRAGASTSASRRRAVQRRGEARSRRADLRAAGTRATAGRRQVDRQILGAVHGEVGVAAQQRVFELLHELPLAVVAGERRRAATDRRWS